MSAVRRLAVCDAARQLQLARLRRHPVQAGSDTRTLCLSPQHGPVSSGPRCRRAVSRGRRRDGRSFGFGDRQPTHRSCVAHLGDQPGARRHLEPLVGSRFATAPSSHIILYQYDQRVLLDCYYARVLWLQGLGDQARRHTESLVEYARTKDHLLSLLYSLLIAACPIALYIGDLTTADHHVRLAFDVAARHALEVWKIGRASCRERV